MVCLALVTVPRLCFALGKQQTTNRPFSPFFEVVRLRWVLGGIFSHQESHWCITLSITNVPVDTATGLSNLLILLEGNLS
jgi:hypothetical protein